MSLTEQGIWANTNDLTGRVEITDRSVLFEETGPCRDLIWNFNKSILGATVTALVQRFTGRGEIVTLNRERLGIDTLDIVPGEVYTPVQTSRKTWEFYFNQPRLVTTDTHANLQNFLALGLGNAEQAVRAFYHNRHGVLFLDKPLVVGNLAYRSDRVPILTRVLFIRPTSPLYL